MKSLKIGVYGSSAGSTIEKNILRAREVGKEIAKNKCILVNGACKGLPYEAANSAHNLGGKTIGFSTATSLKNHLKNKNPVISNDRLYFIPKNYKHKKNVFVCMKYRNVNSVAFSDAAIFISGRTGTMNEFTIAFDCGKIIGVLSGTGGVSDNEISSLVKNIDKDNGAKIIFDSNPKTLVKKVIEEAKRK